MNKIILITFLLLIIGCTNNKPVPKDIKKDYPKETPNTFYDYSEQGYISQYANECDLGYYKGKVIKEIRTQNTDVIINFTDGTYIYLQIYKYNPKLKFFKK